MKRVLCLYRVSSLKQVQDNDIPLQRAETKAFIAKKASEGWVFCGEKLEKGISGYKNKVTDRDVLIEILGMAERKEFDILLVYMSDRLGRREDETPVYVSRLNELGIEVWSVNEGQLKTEEHIDKLINYIRFWKAQGESLTTGIRVRDAQLDLIKQGKYAGGRVPYGYKLEFTGEIDKKGRALRRLVIDNEQAPIVYEIFDYVYSYDYGARRIAKSLNERCIPSPSGNKWNISSVGGMLKNPIYSGRIAYRKYQANGKRARQAKDKWVLSDEINPDWIIIPEGMFNKVQKILESHKVKPSEAVQVMTPTHGQLLLTGLVYCGYCGGRLSNGSGYYYWTTQDEIKHKRIVMRYKCNNKRTGKINCESPDSYVADLLESVVKEAVSKYMKQLQALDMESDIAKRKDSLSRRRRLSEETYTKQRSKLQSDITIMQEKIPDILRGDIDLPLPMLKQIIEEKQDQLNNLEQEYQATIQSMEQENLESQDLEVISNLISDWDNQFNTAPLDVQKALIHKVVNRIEVKRDSLKIELKISVDDLIYRKVYGNDRSN